MKKDSFIEKYLQQQDRILARKSAIEAFNKQPSGTKDYSSVAQDTVNSLLNHTLAADKPGKTEAEKAVHRISTKLQKDFDKSYNKNRAEAARKAASIYRKRFLIRSVGIGIVLIIIVGLGLSGPIGGEITIETANPAMVKLAQQAGMSRQGEVLFLKTKPQLVSDSQMESDCSANTAANNSDGFIEQGCYDPTSNRIYIRQMPSDLYDLEVSTAAYEMLHPVYINIYNSGQGSALDKSIEANYQAINDSFLTSQVANFAKTEPGAKDLELFSLLGTGYSTLTQDLASYYQPYFSNIGDSISANNQVTQLFQNDLSQLTQLTTTLNTDNNDINSTYNNANTAYNDSVSWANAGNSYEDNYNYNIYSQDFNIYTQDITDYNNTVSQYNQILQSYNDLISQYNGQQFNQASPVQTQAAKPIIIMSKPLLEIPFSLKSPLPTTKVLEIYENSIVYDGYEYPLEEMEGISSSVTKHYVNGIYTGTSFAFVIYTDSGNIKISFRQLKNKDKDNTGSYNLLVKVAREFFGPRIVNRIVKEIFDEGEYKVGKLTFTPDSIVRKGLFSGKELSYEDITSYEVGSGTMILKTSDNKPIRTLLGVKNAYLLPNICQALYDANNKTF